jgi:hypothetical protein
LLPPQRVQPLPQRRRFAVHPRCRRARGVGLERSARVGVGFPLRRRGGGVGGGGRGGLLRERLLVLRLTKRTAEPNQETEVDAKHPFTLLLTRAWGTPSQGGVGGTNSVGVIRVWGGYLERVEFGRQSLQRRGGGVLGLSAQKLDSPRRLAALPRRLGALQLFRRSLGRRSHGLLRGRLLLPHCCRRPLHLGKKNWLHYVSRITSSFLLASAINLFLFKTTVGEVSGHASHRSGELRFGRKEVISARQRVP